MKREKEFGTVRIMRVAKSDDIGIVRKGKTAETKKRYSIWFEPLSAQKSPLMCNTTAFCDTTLIRLGFAMASAVL